MFYKILCSAFFTVICLSFAQKEPNGKTNPQYFPYPYQANNNPYQSYYYYGATPQGQNIVYYPSPYYFPTQNSIEQTKTPPQYFPLSQNSYPFPSMVNGQQQRANSDNLGNIKTEIIDVSPEYHLQLLGLDQNPRYNAPTAARSEQIYNPVPSKQRTSKTRYVVKTDQNASVFSNVPLTKSKDKFNSYSGHIRRTIVSGPNEEMEPIHLKFVNGILMEDSSKNGSVSTTHKRILSGSADYHKMEPINLNFLNGVLQTEAPSTVPPKDENDEEERAEEDYSETTEQTETTTENEDPEDIDSWFD